MKRTRRALAEVQAGLLTLVRGFVASHRRVAVPLRLFFGHSACVGAAGVAAPAISVVLPVPHQHAPLLPYCPVSRSTASQPARSS